MVRKGFLQIRVNEDEEQRMKALATEAGVSVSSLFRDHMNRVRVRNREDERGRLRILTRLNTNLNMIAHWANKHRSGADAVQVIAQLMSLERAIERLVLQQEKAGEE